MTDISNVQPLRQQKLDAGWLRLYDSYLTHTCTLRRWGNTDEIGRLVGGELVNDVPCFIERTRNRVVTPTQTQNQLIWVVDIPHNIGVKSGDYLLSGQDIDGLVFFTQVRINAVDYTVSEQAGLFVQSARCTDG